MAPICRARPARRPQNRFVCAQLGSARLDWLASQPTTARVGGRKLNKLIGKHGTRPSLIKSLAAGSGRRQANKLVLANFRPITLAAAAQLIGAS